MYVFLYEKELQWSKYNGTIFTSYLNCSVDVWMYEVEGNVNTPYLSELTSIYFPASLI